MKYFALIAILLALGSCQGAEIAEKLAGQTRAVDSIIVDVLEKLKVDCVNGFPELGIPSCAPLHFSHKQFDLSTGEMHALGEFDDITIHGLNEFEIRIMSSNLVLSRIKFELNFASLNLTTKYKADVGMGKRMLRDGGLFMALEDLNLSGQIRYSTGLVGSNNYLRLKEFTVNIKVGNVVSNIENLSKYRIVNRKMNEVVEEFINLSINDNTELVAGWLDNTVTPLVNEMIGERTLKDLLEIIKG